MQKLKRVNNNQSVLLQIISSDSETEDLPKDELFAGSVLMKKGNVDVEFWISCMWIKANNLYLQILFYISNALKGGEGL